MERSLCLLVIICVFVNLGEAEKARKGGGIFGWRMLQPNIPKSIAEICGPSTSPYLANEVFRSFTEASNYAIGMRNNRGGWTPETFVSTARAIWNLQLSTDGEWYYEQNMDEEQNQFGRWHRGRWQQDVPSDSTKLSVRQLEVEVLSFLTQYLNGQDSMRLMPNTDFAAHLLSLGLTCHNIFDFFGHNLYNIMNDRLRRSGDGVTDGAPISGPATSASCDSIVPGGSANRAFFYGFGLMVACQNADVINPDFFRCTIEAQNNHLFMEELLIPGTGPYPLGWADLQLMAMSCLKDRVPEQYKDQWSAIIDRISNWMINKQQVDGSFGADDLGELNIVATIMAIQSLKSAEVSFDRWDCEAAVSNLITFQQNDEGQVGGSLGVTLLALPSLAGQSIAYGNEIKPECKTPTA